MTGPYTPPATDGGHYKTHDETHTETRLTRLEELVFFQERLLQQLNIALTGQQGQIDHLERALQRAQAHISELRMLLDNGGGESAPPPHYQAL